MHRPFTPASIDLQAQQSCPLFASSLLSFTPPGRRGGGGRGGGGGGGGGRRPPPPPPGPAVQLAPKGRWQVFAAGPQLVLCMHIV